MRAEGDVGEVDVAHDIVIIFGVCGVLGEELLQRYYQPLNGLYDMA